MDSPDCNQKTITGSSKFSRRHPFACWFATMLMCFAGTILVNFITGTALFTCFDDHTSVLTATAVCTTKISMLASIVFYLEFLDMIPLPDNHVFLGVSMALIYFRLTMLILGLKDFFVPVENLICTVAFGGMVDALRVAVAGNGNSMSPAGTNSSSSLGDASSTQSGTSSAGSMAPDAASGGAMATSTAGMGNASDNTVLGGSGGGVTSSGTNSLSAGTTGLPTDKKRD